MPYSRHEDDKESNRSKGKNRGSLFHGDQSEYPISYEDDNNHDYNDYSTDSRAQGAHSRPRRTKYEQPLSPIPSASVRSGDSRYYDYETRDNRNRRRLAQTKRLQDSTSRHGSTPNSHRALPDVNTELVTAFADIDLVDFAECRNFVEDYPEILEADPNLFTDAAQDACVKGEADVAERCLHRALLLGFCQTSTSFDEQMNYLDSLVERDVTNYSQFENRFANVKREKLSGANLSTQSIVPHRQPTQTQPMSVTAMTQQGKNLTPKDPENTMHRSIHQSQVTNPQFTTNVLPKVRRDSQSQNQSQRDPKSMAPGNRTRSNSKPGPVKEPSDTRRSVSSTRQNQSYGAASARVSRTSLYRNYRVQSSPNCFFQAGRVFKTLWHESSGSNMQGEVNEANHYQGKYGELVYSKIRWMMVIKPRIGYCICCPISTYDGKGLSRRNFSDMDIAAHAIIHRAGSPPVALEGELKYTKKMRKPIPVCAADGQVIEETSRIHLGQFLTVLHNLKVTNVGMVPPEHIDRVVRYAKSEFEKVIECH